MCVMICFIAEDDAPADEMESEKKEYSMHSSKHDFIKPAEPDRMDKSYIGINEVGG